MYNNNQSANVGECFLTPHEDKKGRTYFKGAVIFADGKGVKLRVFPIDARKAAFKVKAYKFKLNQNKRAAW